MTIKATWENIELTEKAHSVNSYLETWKDCGWLPEQLVEHGLARIIQPVFIDGAEYILHFNDEPPHRAWYKSGTNQFYEGTNRYPASDFGKHFTVELVAMRESPETPTIGLNVFLTHLRNIYGNPNATLDEILDDYRKCADKCDQIAESELPTTSLYNRVLKALGERDVPIGGEDHLVGQVKVDHIKATLLDKIIEEFKVPEGGDVIKWLHKDTSKDKKVEGLINGLKQLLDLKPDSTINELFISTEELVLRRDALLDRATPRNKYDREILPGVHVDVYDVLSAFKTDSAAIDHAVKKLLAPGQRGVKDRITDLNEAINSIQREIERLGEWELVSSKPMSVNKIRESMGVEPTEGLRADGGHMPNHATCIIGERGPTTHSHGDRTTGERGEK